MEIAKQPMKSHQNQGVRYPQRFQRTVPRTVPPVAAGRLCFRMPWECQKNGGNVVA
jgi:hypothetical protein